MSTNTLLLALWKTSQDDRAVHPAAAARPARPDAVPPRLRLRLQDLPHRGQRVPARPLAVSAAEARRAAAPAQLRVPGSDGPAVRAVRAAAVEGRRGHLRVRARRAASRGRCACCRFATGGSTRSRSCCCRSSSGSAWGRSARCSRCSSRRSGATATARFPRRCCSRPSSSRSCSWRRSRCGCSSPGGGAPRCSGRLSRSSRRSRRGRSSASPGSATTAASSRCSRPGRSVRASRSPRSGSRAV